MALLLMETGEVASRLKLSSTRVHALTRTGALPLAATTRRGLRLFDPQDVEAVARARAERLRGLANELD